MSRTCRIQAASIARLRDRQCAMAVAVHKMRAHKKRSAPREQAATKEIAPAEVKHTTRFCLGAVHYPTVTYYSLGRSGGSVRQPQRSDLHYTGSIPSLYFDAILQVLHCALSVLRLRRLKIATNGKAAGAIANRKSLKTIVGEYEGKLRPTGFRPVGQCFLTLRSMRLSCLFSNSGEPSRTRTCDPLVKSQLLYRLSYRPTRTR